MLRHILLSAGIAGLLSAIVLTLLQMAWITPLIMEAETYEDGALVELAHTETHEHEHAAVDAHSHAAAEHEHHHDASDWKPAEGLQRALFTLGSNIVMGVAYALLLSAVYMFWRQPRSRAEGLLFGLAGFAVFFAAPALGLPPELPGTAAADLAARQQWWLGTAVATALGLALLFAQHNWLLRAAGIAALAAPHLLGAPHPAAPASLAPEQLQAHFRLATVLGNAAFWSLLGLVSTHSWQLINRQTATD